uniref:Uncharacterized protein n=1 Tax=Panagrolaimus sp. JU765 TaxID=591449 RepID=A0AC34PWY3_9BILA
MEDVFLEALPGLKELSGCIHIAYQIQETFYSKDPERPNSNMKISIWPKGTPSQIQSLRKMLTIGLTLIQNETPKQTSERMGKLMIDKLLEIIGPLMTADDIFVMNYIRSSNSFC